MSDKKKDINEFNIRSKELGQAAALGAASTGGAFAFSATLGAIEKKLRERRKKLKTKDAVSKQKKKDDAFLDKIRKEREKERDKKKIKESQRMMELAGIEGEVIEEAFPFGKLAKKLAKKLPFKKASKISKFKGKISTLAPKNIEKVIKKYNRNLQRLTLTDNFADALATAIEYSLSVAGHTAKDIKDNEIKTFGEKLQDKLNIKDNIDWNEVVKIAKKKLK